MLQVTLLTRVLTCDFQLDWPLTKMSMRSATPSPLSVKDTYLMSVGKAPEYGIPEYRMPKPHHYLARQFKISPSKGQGLYYHVDKRAKDPDPAKYAESKEANARRFWAKSIGKFSSSSRKTMIDQVMQRSKGSPGPGSYSKSPTLAETLKQVPLGTFS